jgi:hypothetical protein
MEGTRYSNVPANVDKYGFTAVSVDEIAEKIEACDLIIPF